jgi:hypothetical protein
MPRHGFLILVLVVATSGSVHPQKKSAGSEPAKAPVEKSAAEVEAERVLKERRANAQSLLINLAADARNFSDARVRARTQARIADLLWENDRERSVAMFNSALEAAEVADAESQARMQEDIRRQQTETGRGGYVIDTPPDLRGEVLGLAAKRDQKLREELLGRYQDQQVREAADEGKRQDPRGQDETTTQRSNPDKPVFNSGSILQSLDRQTVDREQTLLDQVERARTSAERDQANLQLAMLMVDKDDRRARDYVDKIDEMELRNGARAYIDASIAFKLYEKKNVERALEFARNSDLTHFQRSWLLSQTAGQIGIKDRERALPVLDDAVAEAGRIETGDPDRPRAFFAIANVVLRINRAAVWETMGQAITAANSAEKFTGEDGQIVFRLTGKGTRAVHQHGFSDFDVAGIFGRLAGEDYDRAVDLARGLQSGAPRANAVIAIARSVLDETKK